MWSVLVVTWGSLLINNPYAIVVILGEALVLLCCVLGCYRKFMGFILFLVYIGGMMILLRYCVMISPAMKLGRTPILTLLFAVLLYSLPPLNSSFAYGILYCARTIFLVALLLYLVLLAVVELICYSRGLLKLYVICLSVFLDGGCGLFLAIVIGMLILRRKRLQREDQSVRMRIRPHK